MMQKGYIPIVLLGAIFLVLAFPGAAAYYYQQQKVKAINSYEECAKVYPILMSYPGQCNTPDGRHFVQQLSEEEKKKLQPPSPKSMDISADWGNYVFFDYPKTWKLDHTVFYDESDHKVAEVFPDYLENMCPESHDPNREVIISQNKYSEHGLDVYKTITKVEYEGGPKGGGIWYPNSYCITDGVKGFVVILYEDNQDPTKEKNFDQIISTFKFLK